LKREVELEKAPVPIRLHLKARTPTVPETKKRLMFTAMAGGGGFGFVLLLVLFFEVRARRIADLSTVRAHTSAPVLGVIPLVPYGARVGTPKKQRIAAAYWRSVLWEAFDGIRTVLLHNPRFRGPRVIMIASSSVAEGKSTSSSQLAMSLARSGQRTLLVDGDIRRPTMEREFGLQKSAGFCEVLAGQLSLADAVRPSGLPELDLLPAGTLTEGVRSLLARDAHGPLFKEIGASYDFVIIDTSPVLLATDALLLARHVDGVIVLVRKDQTQLVKLENTLQRFDMIGVPILGLLPIGLEDTSPSYGYGYGYGYAYQYATPSPAEAEKTTLELPLREVTTSAT
jgi:succinoglycan biosynthesis transport protein ExoP